MNRKYMKRYWAGYRGAKNMHYECGYRAMVKEHSYGLQGHSPAYCAGWQEYIRRCNHC